MRLDCLLGQHRPLPLPARNQGFEFGTCTHCGGAMLRSGRSWRRVPRGFRIVWRQSGRRAASAAGAASRTAFAATPPRRDRGATPMAPIFPGAARRRRRSVLRGATGLFDLLRAAMRVLLWNVNDRCRGFSLRGIGLWIRALPRRDAALPLPPP